MAAAAILNFENFKFLTVGAVQRVELHHCAEFRQNRPNCSWDMAIFRFFKMAVAAILDIWNLTVVAVKMFEMLHHAKFGQNQLNRGWDMAIIRFFKMAAVAILDFENFKFLTVRAVKRVELHHRAKFRQNRPKCGWDITIFRFFQDGGRPPSWICDACVGTTHEGHLVVFITVQNLVGIDAVVLKICTFFDFASLVWKRLFTPQNWGFLGFLTP